MIVARCSLLSSLVYLSAVSDLRHENSEEAVVNLVDDAVIAYA